MSAKNRGAIRITSDRYMTPAYCIDSLLPHLDISGRNFTFLEPCLGSGAIYNKIPLPKSKKKYCELYEGIDYLEKKFNRKLDLIVTNPPFSLASEFLEKSLTEADTVIYLLRLNFLASQSRKEFWGLNPPSRLFVLSKRPVFAWICKSKVIEVHKGYNKEVACGAQYAPGYRGKCKVCKGPAENIKPGTDATDYAWFVWERRPGKIVKRCGGPIVVI